MFHIMQENFMADNLATALVRKVPACLLETAQYDRRST